MDLNSNDHEARRERAQRIEDAIASDEVFKIYANGFINAFNPSDTITVLLQNNQPVAVVNMSYTVAKTLAEKLLRMVKHLEESTGNEIMTTDYIDFKLKKSKEDKNGSKTVQ